MSFPKPFYKWRPHPWHGLRAGSDAPNVLNAYIEITPFDYVKYEVDKETGYLRVDRPQQTSSQPPTLYGFIPRTFCGARVQSLSPNSRVGDRDPLDICVLSERPITKSDIILRCRPVGGLQMVDGGEADDKIIAVLADDPIWGQARVLDDIPKSLVERLRHYFLTYKFSPDVPTKVEIAAVYDSEHAHKVILASIDDYRDEYGT
ncbi:MAG: inorganic pyrophosphatase [Myxococcota bacterium]|nr:inorganic pyrophosphatase [Myxococcota bacterium]